MPLCPLCSATSVSIIPFNKLPSDYFLCRACDLRYLNPQKRLSPEAEKARYLQHNNDITDVRYQEFVEPLFLEIKKRAPQGSTGLDYGAGTGPVLSERLKEASYRMTLWDPYFWPNPSALEKAYDFVGSCEVVEHFFEPQREFKRIRSLLKPGGFFAIMTLLYEPSTDFESWYYRRDPTHVVFYSKQTFNWIQSAFGYTKVDQISNRLVVLETK